MVTIAHLIHPVVVDPSSDLVTAQPITFEAMSAARRFARDQAEVTLLAVQYYDEERLPLSHGFRRLPDLDRSVTDIKTFKQQRKLALIKDLLDRLYHASDADYLIYTNVDIAPMPYFYATLERIIAQGYDAFIINRRTISARHQKPAEIFFMYSELGEKHPGWDCFIFKRSAYPRFELGTACIGTGWIGRVMITNMACFAKKFHIFTDLHLTFHIGDEQAWKTGQFEDYWKHNREECKKILMKFDKIYGPFDRNKMPGRFFRLLEQKPKFEES